MHLYRPTGSRRENDRTQDTRGMRSPRVRFGAGRGPTRGGKLDLPEPWLGFKRADICLCYHENAKPNKTQPFLPNVELSSKSDALLSVWAGTKSLRFLRKPCNSSQPPRTAWSSGTGWRGQGSGQRKLPASGETQRILAAEILGKHHCPQTTQTSSLPKFPPYNNT